MTYKISSVNWKYVTFCLGGFLNTQNLNMLTIFTYFIQDSTYSPPKTNFAILFNTYNIVCMF